MASATSIRRARRSVRKAAQRLGFSSVRCGGDGLLVLDLDSPTTHFTLAAFAEAVNRELPGDVDVVTTIGLTGRHVRTDDFDHDPL